MHLSQEIKLLLIFMMVYILGDTVTESEISVSMHFPS
jgi:hypothetical protein